MLRFVDEPMGEGTSVRAFRTRDCARADLTWVGDTLEGEGFTEGRECTRRDADTVRVLYQEASGAVWLTGRRVYVDSARLAGLADSVEISLDKRLGPAKRCHIDLANDIYTERLRVWPNAHETWYLRTSVLQARNSLLPAIWFERVRGRRGCDGWIWLIPGPK